MKESRFATLWESDDSNFHVNHYARIDGDGQVMLAALLQIAPCEISTPHLPMFESVLSVDMTTVD